MGSIIARHNSKLLRSAAETLPRRQPHCNCQKKQECPVPVYQLTVTSAGGGVETYVGLAKNFKKRYPKHKKHLLVESPVGSTSLSKHYWKEEHAGKDPKVTWRFWEKNVPVYNPITRKCRLCLSEKFTIILKPGLASHNSRQEIFAHCRHLQSELISGTPD